jgi:hypothetical protein
MLKISKNGFNSMKSAFQPFLWAMLFVFGFHFTHVSGIEGENTEGTFYELCNTKVSSPSLSLQNSHYPDLTAFESEEKEEKSESESNLDYAIGNSNAIFVAGFFQISGAAKQSLKIPSSEGKAPLYILFKNFRVHLA